MNQNNLQYLFSIFDSATMLIFILIVFCAMFWGLIYYHDQVIEAQEKLKDVEARNDILQRSLFRIVHYFDENDIASHKNSIYKAQAIVDARIALTGCIASENREG